MSRRFAYRVPVDQERLDVAHRLLREHRAAASTDEARAERLWERHKRWLDPSLEFLQAKATDRPCGGGWLVCRSTGRISPRRCKSWRCPKCARRLRACAATTIREGLEALPEGQAVAFLTFTDRADAVLTFGTLYKAWERTRVALRRELGMGSYALAVELQRRGALHVHAVATISEEVVPLLRPAGQRKRNATQYDWHFRHFSPMAERLGWGRIADAQVVRESDLLVGYVVKALAGYVGKGSESLAAYANQRLRPFRTSRGWPVQFSEVCSRTPVGGNAGPWEPVKVTVDSPRSS